MSQEKKENGEKEVRIEAAEKKPNRKISQRRCLKETERKEEEEENQEEEQGKKEEKGLAVVTLIVRQHH